MKANTVQKLAATEAGKDDTLTEEEEQYMVAKLREAGKYSIKPKKKSNECEICIYYQKN